MLTTARENSSSIRSKTTDRRNAYRLCRRIAALLIVDDYRASADTVAMLVDVWGHDVRRAYDGPTGLALAAAYKPDVLLLDIIMPGMTGLEVARRVRQQTRLNDCFIIAVTGRTTQDTGCNARRQASTCFSSNQ